MSFLYLGRKNFFTNRLVEKFCTFFLKKKNLGKIQFSPPNYHRFSGWHLKLPKLRFRPLKLPNACILAPSVSLGRLTGRKPSHVRVT